jgi:glycosyltransferase involved in cell wall biosynthesis
VATFSVIVPTRDRADVLGRALRSVLAQTFPDFEVVVVDDGSGDGTREVVDALGDPRVRYVYRDHAGVSAARNVGAAQATGRYLTFLDSDDEALPGWLEALAEGLAHPRVGIVCCGAQVSARGDDDRVRLPASMGPAFRHQEGLFLAGTFALRREIFEGVGGYVAGLPYSENSELALRLVPLCGDRGWAIATLAEPLVRIHPRNGSPTREEARLIGAKYILEHHREAMASDPIELSSYLAVAGVSAVRTGRHREARAHFAGAVLTHPWSPRNYARLVVSLSPALSRRVWLTGRRNGLERGDDRP